MAEAVKLLKEILTLTSNVGELKGDVEKLWTRVEENRERIIKLEQNASFYEKEMNSKISENVSSKYAEIVSHFYELEKKLPPSPDSTKQIK